MTCKECYSHPPTPWYDQPMNEEIRKRRSIQPPKQFHPSFMAAAQAWGTHITEGLHGKPN